MNTLVGSDDGVVAVASRSGQSKRDVVDRTPCPLMFAVFV